MCRYICTRPMAITELIFRPEDRPILTYLEDDGISVEPEFYVPIIPMVLVNGAAGIGVGFSTNVPCFNPLEILRKLRSGDLKGFDKMTPWYRGFRGSIAVAKKRSQQTSPDEAGGDGAGAGLRYATTGIVRKTGPKTASVTELPIGFWTDDFKKLLEAKIALSPSPLLKYDVQYTDSDTFEFLLTFRTEADLDQAKFNDEYKLTVATNAISTTNMHLFNERAQIVKYPTVRAIVDEFVRTRLEYYSKRKKYMHAKLSDENKVLENKARFIEEVVAGKIVLGRRAIDQVFAELAAKKYLKVDDSYRYLVDMPLASLTLERKAKLDAEIAANVKLIRYYAETPEKEIWNKELDELEAALVKMKVYGA